jgi:RNA polymerase sigma factor (sigma-70 family)
MFPKFNLSDICNRRAICHVKLPEMVYKGDAYYINEVLKGSTNAFAFLVNRHKDNAFNLALRICGNREEAEEVAQDAFLKVFRSLGDFRHKSSFATWLYKIVYNTSISYLRARKREVLSLEDFPADANDFIGSCENDEEAEREYRNALVSYALQRLNENDRAVITLYYYEEMSLAEIADITSITKENIKIRLHRARKKMLEDIERTEKRKNSYHG